MVQKAVYSTRGFSLFFLLKNFFYFFKQIIFLVYTILHSNHNEGVPPDTIPNSAVKPFSADDTLIGKVGRCFFYFLEYNSLSIYGNKICKKNRLVMLLKKKLLVKNFLRKTNLIF